MHMLDYSPRSIKPTVHVVLLLCVVWQAKHGVVVTARVHPGETNSSWMMKGLLDYLTSNAADAKVPYDCWLLTVFCLFNSWYKVI